MLISSLPSANPPLPEHKIGVFVRFWGLEPLFSDISSTNSRFLCFFGVWNPHFRAFRAQNRHFCAQEEGKVGSESVTAETLTTLPPHLRRRTSAPAPATAPSNRTRRRQVLSRRLLAPSGTVLAACSAVQAPSSAAKSRLVRVMPSSTV